MKLLIKAIKSLLFSSILISSIILFVLAINSDLRRAVFQKAIHVYQIHEESVIRTLVQQERYAELSNRIIQNITLSTKISKGRTLMFNEILHQTEFAAERDAERTYNS